MSAAESNNPNKELGFKLRDKVFAGDSALEDQERIHFLNEFNTELRKIIDENIFEKFTDVISIWEEILNSAVSSNIGYAVAEKIDANLMFDFGNYLLTCRKNLISDGIPNLNKLIHGYLDIFRLSEFLTKIYDERRWDDLILRLIEDSNFTFGKLFDQRKKEYATKSLFNLISGKIKQEISWQQVSKKVDELALAIANNISFPDSKVAFLMTNSLLMVELDLACLTNGIVNVMLPGNSVPQNIEFILNQNKAELLLISDEKQLQKIKAIKSRLTFVKRVVLLEGISAEDWVLSFNEFISYENNGRELLKTIRETTTPNSLATLMYTSGTTGEPKGIKFLNKNIVYKRFCRAMALPKISDKDVFLAFLPLFHTFGRFLEMTGSVFWGTEYVFMQNPAVHTMISNMQLVNPSIFISIPKKWMELYEQINDTVDIEFDDDDKIKDAVLNITGGNLKWGISAAGYLPPEIFKFFQKYGIELMSGFGMTEATGGITLTPPNKYIENSLGGALPGIKIKLADDGELLIKGGYVMDGYFGQDKTEVFDAQGWFATGDIMRMDENGFITIIDRKKEIYKNIKGETVSPQKIENFFRDFDSVKQVFLVGDHKPFNTVLIFPNEGNESFLKVKNNTENLRQYFSSVVVTVNKFLASFERIIDFRIIERPFTAELGELTPKGTYKRSIIAEHFKGVIDEMYRKNYTSLKIDKTEVRIPNWFLREKSCLISDIVQIENGISIPKFDSKIFVKKTDVKRNIFQIGDYKYKLNSDYLDFQTLLTNPLYWLGNNGLVKFTGEDIVQWSRNRNHGNDIEFVEKVDADYNLPIEQLKKIFAAGEKSILGLHFALLQFLSKNEEAASYTLDYLNFLISEKESLVYKFALTTFEYPKLTHFNALRKKMFVYLIKNMHSNNFEHYLDLYLREVPGLMDEEVIRAISGLKGRVKILEAIENVLADRTHNFENGNKEIISIVKSLFVLLSSYGIAHPTLYKQIRQVLVNYQLNESNSDLAEIALSERDRLRAGFRSFLGKNQQIAVDEDTGEEYTWEDVIILEEDLNYEDKQILIEAITKTSLLRESIFLFSGGKMIRLDNILPGGIWVSALREDAYKKVFKISVQTDLFGSYDIVLNLNKNSTKKDIIEEVSWLVLTHSKYFGPELVGEFGGLWIDVEVWTHKFIPGFPVGKFIDRKFKKKNKKENERLYHQWPFFVWNVAELYFGFWKLTHKKLILGNVSADNFVVPTHDYQTGSHIISISERENFKSIKLMFEKFYFDMIEVTEKAYPIIKRGKIWKYIAGGVINSFGEKAGIKIIKDFVNEYKNDNSDFGNKVKTEMNKFLSNVEVNGFIPKQLYFAINRFHRWFKLNSKASFTAQAESLKEFFDTYQLGKLFETYPETRTRFFLETVFINSSDDVKKYLRDIIREQRNYELPIEDALLRFSSIKSEIKITEKDDFFLTRLSYPHIRPSDEAEILQIKTDGILDSNLVVQFDDYDGNPFVIRNPISPKEISKLHKLYLEANLLVNFSNENHFLVALSERGFIIGGLFYLYLDKATVYMDKIVVANRYRRMGIGEKLMNEFFERLRTRNFKQVVTGFFRPEYFYQFGFKIDRKHSGLVKKL